ncbi:MAG: 4Fe-4S binding protein [Opitutales bacterium]|nr:4Fe-4S binding protein [Opitutales bacterium]
MKDLREKIIERLKSDGADIVRFGDARKMKDGAPLKIMPEAKTAICAAFRQLRGARRGIEEGSTYYQYTTNAVETLEETVMPLALLRASELLEEEGFDALPQRRNQLVMSDESSTNPEVDYAEIYRGKTRETQMDFEQCAVDCGLGERGLSGSVLTDDFGPFQRWAFILTDAQIAPDPIVEPHLCDKCGACVKACPGRALAPDGSLDKWQCAAYYMGANRSKNPFMPKDAYDDLPEKARVVAGEAKLTPELAREVIDRTHFYPPIKHAYCASICGRACDTECYVRLEERGVLKRKFKTPFRKRPQWSLDVDGD